jgi:Holliday junction resolvase
MNASAKGRRAEYRSARLLEAAGYVVFRSAASKGVFDLIAIGPTDLCLVQVKCARPPSPAEHETLRLFAAPANCKKLAHVWKPRARFPMVTEL